MIKLTKKDKEIISLALRCYYEVYGFSIDEKRVNELVKLMEEKK